MRKDIPLLLTSLLALLCLSGCQKTAMSPTVTDVASTTVEAEYTHPSIDTASASELWDQAYTNVPGTPTQNAVLDQAIFCFPETGAQTRSPVTVLEPDALIVDSLTDIYDFVQKQEKMPVRYFPEDVQQQVQQILNGSSVDILHISEFYGIRPQVELTDVKTAQGWVQLDADYQAGQLVVIMFGDAGYLTRNEPENIRWTPLAAQVTTPGQITFNIPTTLLEDINGQETLFLVLTVRPGGDASGEQIGQSEQNPGFIPSKDSGDLTTAQSTVTSADGSVLPDDFRIFLREHTQLSREEIRRLQAYLQQAQSGIATYFSEDLRSQMALLLDTVQPESLICYNANYLGAEHYVETYGDVIAAFRFPTDYPEGTELICLLGTPVDPLPQSQSNDPIVPEESAFSWAVLRGEVKDGYVRLTFPQQLIPVMEAKGALALILSEPITVRG